MKLEFREKDLVISRKNILTRRTRVICHTYSDLRAELFETFTGKGYGGGVGAYIKQLLVKIHTPDDKIAFDISGEFPDFTERKEILKLVTERIEVSKESQSLSDVKKSHIKSTAVFLGVLLFIAILFEVYGI